MYLSLQEFGCGSESRDRVADNFQQEPQRVPYGVIIINNGYRTMIDLGHF
jgi:hypothetical protein